MTTRRSDMESGARARLPDLPDIADRGMGERWEDELDSRVRGGISTSRQRTIGARYVPDRAQSDGHHLACNRASARTPPETIVLPPARLVLAQAIPNLVTAAALLIVGLFHSQMSPGGKPIWAIAALVPSLLLLILTNAATNPLWRRVALINLATIGVVLPILSIRRYLASSAYEDSFQGALLAPVLATIGAIVSLAVLGFAVAVVSHEDPEYAGVIILPACMLVPACSGASQSHLLQGSMLVAAAVFAAAAVATVFASLVPGAFPALVAPGVLAAEFIFLTLLRRVPVFPADATSPISLLFIALLLTAVLQTVLIPVLSVWCGRVRLEMRKREYERGDRP